jgi:hypothetical protein
MNDAGRRIGTIKLTYDSRDQKWSFAYCSRFYLWVCDPFDRAAAEAFARQIIGRLQREGGL